MMTCEYELDFLLDVFKKSHIRTRMIAPTDSADVITDSWIDSIVDLPSDVTVRDVIGEVENLTRYTYTNELKLKFILMKLPLGERNIFLIGPYLSAPLTREEIMEIGESLGLVPSVQKNLREYYASIPQISDSDHIFCALDTFCERVFHTSSFALVQINGRRTLPLGRAQVSDDGGNIDRTLSDMENLGKRYEIENELMHAVTLGEEHKQRMFSVLDGKKFEQRIRDTLRNSQNYLIIMNTLLRKAAENGGVHPLYIDRMSTDFALEIEQLSDVKDVTELMKRMFVSYCRLVRKHATAGYSPVVKKTVALIDADISAELTLSILAGKQGISPGYLATVFKKETHKTISEYIRSRRMERAVHLLATTNLQIQSIAGYCGIMDIQYFTKLFKKHTGKTPNEYRKELRKV